MRSVKEVSLEQLENVKCKIVKERESLEKETKILEEKVGLGTPRFIHAQECDARELENNYDILEQYDNQIKRLEIKIRKMKEKNTIRNKR